MKNNNFYANEITALIKSGKTPQEAVKIAGSHVGNYEKLVKQSEEERKIEKQINTDLLYYTGEITALIKAGKTPEEAVKIADSHKGNVNKCIEEIEESRHL